MVGIGAVRFVWCISLIGAAALVGRLLFTGLYIRYPAFTAYLSASLLRSVVLALFSPDPTTAQYRLVWMVSEPANIILQIAMSLEIYRRIGEHYQNLGAFGYRVLLSLTLVSALACAATLGPDLTATDWRLPLAQFLFLLKRAEATLLFGGLLLTLGFYRWWYTPKCPNVTHHAVISCAHFGALSGYYFSLNVFHVAQWPATVVHLSAMFGCSIAWALSLSRQGEIVTPRPPMTPERYQEAKAAWAMLLEFAAIINHQKFSRQKSR